MTRFLPAVVLAVALAAPAGAIDLTGTWEEVRHQTCTGLTAAGEKVALKNKTTGFGDIRLTQDGTALYLAIPGYLWEFEGFAYSEPVETRGQGFLQKCPGGIQMPDPYVSYRITKAQTFPANAKGVSGKMTTLYVFGSSDRTYSCNIYWQRISTDDPGAGPCN